MMRSLSLRAGAALLALVLCAAGARADMSLSTPDWEVFLSPQPASRFVQASVRPFAQVGVLLDPSPEVMGSGSGTVSMPLLPVMNFPPGNDERNETFTFNARGSRFGFYARVIDLASHRMHRFEFDGYFSGTMTASASNLAAVFTSPTIQSRQIGDTTYTVSASYSPVGAPGFEDPSNPIPGVPGAFNVEISSGPSPGPTATPEPSALLLALCGLPLAGFASWRTRRH